MASNCDNRGCIYTGSVTVTLPTGKKKRICGHCYETEGWGRKREAKVRVGVIYQPSKIHRKTRVKKP